MANPESFVSQLPQPTRYGLASPPKPLGEMNASATNSRAAMPPPATAGHKRQGSNLPEPTTKRRTLADRAGDFKPNPTAQRPNPGVMSAAQSKAPTTFSQSYRTQSNASRDTSASSISSNFSASLGNPTRFAASRSTSSLARPKSSLARDRTTRRAESRFDTAQGTQPGVADVPNGKRMISLSHKPKMTPAPSLATNGNALSPTKQRVRNVSPVKDPSTTMNTCAKRIRTISMLSLADKLSNLSFDPQTPVSGARSESPSRLPRPPSSSRPCSPVARDPFTPKSFTPSPFPKDARTTPRRRARRQYLTKDSNLVAWDPEEQYGNIERMYNQVCQHYEKAMEDNVAAGEINNSYKSTISALEQDRKEATQAIIDLKCELETTKFKLESAERRIHEAGRDHEDTTEEIKRQHRMELDICRQTARNDMEQLKADHRDELRELKRILGEELESERTQRIQALGQASTQEALEKQRHQMDLDIKERELRLKDSEIDRLKADLEREQRLSEDLRRNLSSAGDNAVNMESARQALQAKIEYLESDSKSQSEAYADMENRMNEALAIAAESLEKLRREEMLRRKLHNQVQELKGNIRVFCRVRPTNDMDGAEETAKITFPPSESEDELRDIEVKGPEETSSLGKVTTKTHQFSFDRVFDPSSNNNDVFGEISQLIQSALDGYNVCIFAYGQTGSGKTYTMSSEDGMIPRALRQIYTTSKELEERGWHYTMQGSFVEVYNEELRDLLGKDDGNKKHQIIHDAATCETTITDATVLSLDSQDQVEEILAQAMSRRSVAATKANERSSRSHSVFILKLQGYNSVTGQKSKGTLNLVDLAGSERLSHSKAEGARLKETQNINKSLSCLGDVIGALGQQQQSSHSTTSSTANGGGKDTAPSARAGSPTRPSASAPSGHIPYRNSKLTYLLQYSLGGNSKTLMFVMVAPEKKCLSETITSLKFADKVSRTKIGVAKKTTR